MNPTAERVDYWRLATKGNEYRRYQVRIFHTGTIASAKNTATTHQAN